MLHDLQGAQYLLRSPMFVSIPVQSSDTSADFDYLAPMLMLDFLQDTVRLSNTSQ